MDVSTIPKDGWLDERSPRIGHVLARSSIPISKINRYERGHDALGILYAQGSSFTLCCLGVVALLIFSDRG